MGNHGISGLGDNSYAECLNLKESKNHSEGKPQKRLVKIRGVSKTFEIPCDQKSPLCVRNIYSPIGYGVRRKQRILEMQRRLRTQEILEQCSNLFNSGDGNQNEADNIDVNLNISKTCHESTHSSQIITSRYDEECSAMAAFVMSVYPFLPASKRPTITPKVRQALLELFVGTNLLFLSSDSKQSFICTAVLQLAKTIDDYEGSIAIYKGYDRSFVHSYIPLASVHSISRGMEPQEQEQYSKSNEIFSCEISEKVLQVDPKRAFTLHYHLPTNFYASFVAFNDHDLENWIDAINYFTITNKALRLYIS